MKLDSIIRRASRLTLLLALGCVIPCAPAVAQAAAQDKPPRAYSIQLPPQPDYSPFEWMIGDWTGKTTGKGAQGDVLLSFAYQLGKSFMILREEVSLPAAKDAPATHESLMGILSPGAPGAFEMNLYSSNGFVSRYRVTARHGEIDFQPDGGPLPPPGWLFRRAFRQVNSSQCQASVEVAPPGKAFFNYYTANLSRVTPVATDAAPAAKPADKTDETSKNKAISAPQ